MPTKVQRNPRKPSGTVAAYYGPDKRRAREARLDVAAVGSRKAKFGADEPPPAEPSAPSQVEVLQAELAEALRANGLLDAELQAERARAALLQRALAAAEAREREAQERTAAKEAAAAAELKAIARAAELQAKNDARAAAEREAREQAEREREAAQRAAEEAAERKREPAAGRTAEIPIVPAEGSTPHRAAPPAAAPILLAQAQPAPTALPADPAPRRASPVEARATAATSRGRVDPLSAHGALLIMAPAAGGYAAGCFAELLDRAAKRAPRPDLDHEVDRAFSDPTPRGNPVAEDLRALAQLYREADGFYRNVSVHESGALPLNGNALRASLPVLGGSSIAAQCCEMGG